MLWSHSAGNTVTLPVPITKFISLKGGIEQISSSPLLEGGWTCIFNGEKDGIPGATKEVVRKTAKAVCVCLCDVITLVSKQSRTKPHVSPHKNGSRGLIKGEIVFLQNVFRTVLSATNYTWCCERHDNLGDWGEVNTNAISATGHVKFRHCLSNTI